MNIALLNTTDSGGGAETVVRSLRDGLRDRGHDANLWVGRMRSGNTHESTRLIPSTASMNRSAERYAKKGFYSLGLPASHAFAQSEALDNVDIIHLHNLHGHYFSVDAVPKLAATRPLLWTLHDHFAFTGGCAFPYKCAMWMSQCGSCPELGQYPIVSEFDRTARMQAIKRQAFRTMPVTIITPSRHLGIAARQSGMFPHAEFRTIPYGVDTDLFRPHRAEARQRLNIDKDTPVVFLLAQDLDDPRKGIADAMAALQQLKLTDPLILLAGGGDSTAFYNCKAVGNASAFGKPGTTGEAGPSGEATPLANANSTADALRYRNLKSLGYVDDRQEMAACYAAADVFLFTSGAENFPCSVMEAMASGTPTVAYNIAGVDEQIVDEVTGFLVPEGNRTALAQTLDTALSDPKKLAQMGESARRHALACWTMDKLLDQHEQLYAELLEHRAARKTERRIDARVVSPTTLR